MQNVKKHLELLGHKVEDKVTGMKGVVDSISFDLYGCIQAALNPGIDKDGVQMESRWYDVARLQQTSTEPVMDKPDYDFGFVAEGKHGPAEKTMRHKW